MPKPLAELHQQLGEELTWLCLHWKEYLKLVATNDRRIALLNATAPNFFVHFEDLVWQSTLLGLCRLTDPAHSVGKENLAITRLAAAVDDFDLAKQIKLEADVAVKASSFARDWRNRRVAHRSLELVANPTLHPLASASRADVEAAIEAVAKVLNTLNQHYDAVHHNYQGVVAAFEGSEALIYFLSSGREADEVRKREGKLWHPPDW
jgi:hypothetical protein